ncbi:MAG TPA: class I SAM-dependent methyltransferase [Pyrinomonadaceae bacterium]|nr:class I SAM-dependent methyltransferase [Pyrinomonadaceae bacterium]
MGWLSSKTGQFVYFAQQLGEHDWHGKYVLDFGGNIGNMLRDPESTIDHERYWCLDVVKESIESGKAAFPRAHWVYYDRYSFFFNPDGVRQLTLPAFPQSFDYIVAYSVFPNTPRSDMLDLVGQLKARLAEGGALAFTFIDPNYNPWPDRYDGNNFRWRLEREIFLEQERGRTLDIDVGELCERARDASWLVFVNGKELYLETDAGKNYGPEQQQTHFAFYSAEYMQTLFPEATILPPANDEMQHCCVIRRGDGGRGDTETG